MQKIFQHIQSDANFKDDRIHLGISITCRFQVGKHCEGKTTVKPNLCNFAPTSINPSTSSSAVSNYLICSIAKLKSKEKLPLCIANASTPKVLQHFAQTSEKRFTKCL